MLGFPHELQHNRIMLVEPLNTPLVPSKCNGDMRYRAHAQWDIGRREVEGESEQGTLQAKLNRQLLQARLLNPILAPPRRLWCFYRATQRRSWPQMELAPGMTSRLTPTALWWDGWSKNMSMTRRKRAMRYIDCRSGAGLKHYNVFIRQATNQRQVSCNTQPSASYTWHYECFIVYSETYVTMSCWHYTCGILHLPTRRSLTQHIASTSACVQTRSQLLSKLVFACLVQPGSVDGCPALGSRQKYMNKLWWIYRDSCFPLDVS